MRTLDEAWAWYRAVANGTKRLNHLAKFWDDLPWEGEEPWTEQLKRDNVLRAVSATEMNEDANCVRDELDDLAVLVLFSVFEAVVRDWIQAQIKPEVDGLRHPTLKRAGEDVLDAVAEGSFFRVLDPYKSIDSGLVEQINQVRRFRNWVAHGRRLDKKPDALVQPKEAYDRLKQFLAVLQSPTQSAPPTVP